jgi:hypothetical protein
MNDKMSIIPDYKTGVYDVAIMKNLWNETEYFIERSAHINTLRTGDEFSLFGVFSLQLWKTHDANLPFNMRVDFTHLITQ